MFKLTGHILYSIRPSACLMVGLMAVAAYRPSMTQWNDASLLFLCAFFGSAYCFLINDIFDRKKDILNNKMRPVATGKLPVKKAWSAVTIIGIGYVICAWLLGNVVLGLAIFSLSLFTAYSFVNRRHGLISNLLVAFCASGALWGVAVLKDYEKTLFVLSGALFFMIVFREILLDWLDKEGDKAAGKTSIPIQFSIRSTTLALCASLALATTVLLTGMSPQSLDFYNLIIMGLLASVWFPFSYLAMKPSRERILFNIRFSHVSFILLILAILLR